MKVSFSKPGLPKDGAVVIGIVGKRLSTAAAAYDDLTDGAIKRCIAASSFEGKENQSLAIIAPERTKLRRILLVGLGKKMGDLELQNLGGDIVEHMEGAEELSVSVIVDCGAKDLINAAVQIAYGSRLRAYKFDKYKKKLKGNQKPLIRNFMVHVKGESLARRTYASLAKVADGVFFTRDLVSEPPNVLYPVTFAREVRKLTKLGVKVEVLGEAAMRKLGMGSLLGVGQGSRRESQLVVMQWKGAAASKQPVAFIGKGVTFDTGGISLKPGAGMGEMKWDMGGAGAVAGLMKALAGRKAQVNVIGIFGLVENMPDGNAQRPGDVVKSMSGQTIEVLNTDAEGRLVLADALWYCQKKFKPRLMVDLATLTGAILVSLGKEYAGLFSNDDKLSKQLIAAGETSGEKIWRMPMGDAFDKMIDSKIADMKNIGGRWGGSITAAQFLLRFVNDVPWAHLDIAGMAWSDKNAPTVPRGGTGYGVRLLDRFIRDYCE
ncbi:MAG: leucyl aminopeptidase [Rhodospirillaceae bacterium]|nr:leucyl aminopeptidase [Rhodospirillaceae bacterium]